MPPNPPGSTSADGEVVVTGAPVPTGQVERRGAVTVLWMHPPAGGLRTAVENARFPDVRQLRSSHGEHGPCVVFARWPGPRSMTSLQTPVAG
jgi:hypothetical protein